MQQLAEIWLEITGFQIYHVRQGIFPKFQSEVQKISEQKRILKV